jgi:DNA-directed RNA polymerase subunit RPC12/RpoP
METGRDIICPYCEYEFVDSWEHGDSSDESIECDECGKTFTLQVEQEVTYHTYADCELNDEEHDWQVAIHMSIPSWTWYQCSKCDATKVER